MDIPGNVLSIGESAFSNCDSLESVNISQGVTSIGSKAFYDCTSLADITIPESVTSMGTDMFTYTKIKKITFGGTVNQWKAMNTKNKGTEMKVSCANGTTSSYR